MMSDYNNQLMNQYYIYYEKLSQWIDPEVVFTGLYSQKENAFWLDSSKVEKGLSRFSYMGETKEIIDYSLDSGATDIFSDLNHRLQEIKTEKTEVPFDFVGGFIGYFGYELKALCGFNKAYKSESPDSLWYFVDRLLAFDHEKNEIYVVCLTQDIENAKVWCKEIKDQILAAFLLPERHHKSGEHLVFDLNRDKNQYLKDIDSCKKYLKDGESYEICLTNTITVKSQIDPFYLYKTLRTMNPAPYAAYIKYNSFAILCSSPERFLKIGQNRWIESKPIKGTIRRGVNKSEDLALAKELQASEKNRAENLMIVDLVRNDLGKVCEAGSVSVSKLMEIETYETVHQLVSTICGRQREGVSVIDCIKACFPGGSMTGAPKKRTMEIIDKLEKKARGVYSGVLGFLSANGATDLNIVIRTVVANGNKLSIGAGGAIVDQSDSENEFEEMMLKAKVLIEAISKTNSSTPQCKEHVYESAHRCL